MAHLQPMTPHRLAADFDDYGSDANAVFRACLDAMARPGLIKTLEPQLSPPAPLYPATAAVLLTLADFETRVWLDQPLANHADVSAFLTFHTGAQLTSDLAEATFAVISDVPAMPLLSDFAQGTPEYPDRSATVLIQISELADSGLRLRGPGIETEGRLAVTPSPHALAEQLRHNRSAFPCGVDLIFATDTKIAALPRSVHVVEED